MPVELEIIRAHEFIRLGARGHFDMEASKGVLAMLATACRKRGINQALLDLRALRPGPKPKFTTANLVTLVNTFREVGFTHAQRLAVLYSSDPHNRARLFAFISNLQGWNVEAFDDFEKAIEWLSAGDVSAPEIGLRPTPQKIPVRSLKASPKKKLASRPKHHLPRVRQARQRHRNHVA